MCSRTVSKENQTSRARDLEHTCVPSYLKMPESIARFLIVVIILRNGHLGEKQYKNRQKRGERGVSIHYSQEMKISLTFHKTA